MVQFVDGGRSAKQTYDICIYSLFSFLITDIITYSFCKKVNIVQKTSKGCLWGKRIMTFDNGVVGGKMHALHNSANPCLMC